LRACSCSSQQVGSHDAEAQGIERKRPRPPPPPSLKQSFGPCRWLTDDSISFAYSRLDGSNTDICGSECGKLPDGVLLIDPPTALWLALETDVKHIDEARSALKLADKELVLCPVNDSRDGGAADAGMHWALLVWDRRGCVGADVSDKVGRFFYYDSGFCHMEANHNQAQVLASHLAGKDVPMTVGRCAKQTNTFDCGVYVIVFSELIVKSFLACCAKPPARDGDSGGCEDQEATPPWDARLLTVTPKEVTDRRSFFHRALSTACAAAAAGA